MSRLEIRDQVEFCCPKPIRYGDTLVVLTNPEPRGDKWIVRIAAPEGAIEEAVVSHRVFEGQHFIVVGIKSASAAEWAVFYGVPPASLEAAAEEIEEAVLRNSGFVS